MDHAEIVAMRRACDVLGRGRLDGTLLVTTLEPCLMCLEAARVMRVSAVVYAAASPKFGALSLGLTTPETLRSGPRPLIIQQGCGMLVNDGSDSNPSHPCNACGGESVCTDHGEQRTECRMFFEHARYTSEALLKEFFSKKRNKREKKKE
jgi:cytidine deaminase